MAKDQDQSMEDILQSIKRIIAEEGDGDGEAAPVEASVEAPEASPVAKNSPAAAARPSSAGSDILELTDILPGDVDGGAPVADTTLSVDAVMSMPTASSSTPNPPRVAKKSKPLPPPGALATEGIVSDDTLVSAASSLRSLNQISDNAAARYEPIPSMPLRSGITVEDLVIEALRPMLRSWLDANLPQVVERLVDREVRRISASRQ